MRGTIISYTKLGNYFSKKNMLLKFSDSRRKVNKFIKKEISNDAFNMLYDKPYLKTILQLVLINIEENDLSQTIDEFVVFLSEKLKESLDMPLFIDLLCKNCESVLTSYNPYNENIPTGIIMCPECRINNDLVESIKNDNWDCPEGITYHLLEDICNMKVISKDWYGWCINCSESEIIEQNIYPVNSSTNKEEMESYLKNFYCKKCKSVYEIQPYYGFNSDDDISFWKEGYWLEWYVKRICEKSFPKSIIEQGIIINKDSDQIQMDICLLKSKKTYGIECKAITPFKTAKLEDVANVLKYKNYIDESILVITGRMNKQDEKYLENENVIIINRSDIEKLGIILRKL